MASGLFVVLFEGLQLRQFLSPEEHRKKKKNIVKRRAYRQRLKHDPDFTEKIGKHALTQ